MTAAEHEAACEQIVKEAFKALDSPRYEVTGDMVAWYIAGQLARLREETERSKKKGMK